MSDEVTARYLHDLKSKNADVRQSAAISLRRYVHRASSELSAESLVRYMSELHRRIFDLVNSVELCEKLGGVAILDQLIDGTYEENETKIIRFAHYLRMIFQHTYSSTSGGAGSSSGAGPGPAGSGSGGLGGALLGASGGGGSVGGSDKESLEYRLLQAASAALGHLARVGGTLAADVVEFQVKQSLEWLEGDRSEQRRYAAVLVLKELAENTPTLFNVHVGTFLEHIFHPIRDPKLFIREAATAALRACLTLISKRALRLRSQRYGQIYAEVINSFKSSTTMPGSPAPSPSSHASAAASASSPASAAAAAAANGQAAPVESIHGGLLILNELLRNSGDFMLPRFRDTLDLLLRYKDFCLPPRQEKPLGDASHHTAAFQQAYATHSRIVRDSVVMLLPKMAAFNTEAFIKGGYIEISLAHILAHLRALAQPPGSPAPPSGALHPISREIAFLALGELAILVRERMLPELDSIVYLIRDSLTRRVAGAGGVVAREPCSEALTTLASLAAGVGTKLVPYLQADLIDLVFSQGLSRTLVESLSLICKYLPTTPIAPADAVTMAKASAVIGSIQEKLLLSITTILLAVANNPTSSALVPGAGTSAAAGARGVVSSGGGGGGSTPKAERRGSSLTLAGFLSGPGRAFAPSVFTNASASPAADTRGDSSQFDLLYLSLHTLAVFPFTNHSLLALVRDLHLLSILDYAHPKLRRMAGITCARIIAKTKSATEVQLAQQAAEAARAARAAATGSSIPPPSILQVTTSLSIPSYSPAQVASINDVLERLLIAVLTDPDQELRRALLDCLNQGAGADDPLDDADADAAANDESFEMSGAAMAWEDDAAGSMDSESGLLLSGPRFSTLTAPFGALPSRHRLDAFLIASPSFCHSLFMALNDESFAVRRTAMSILGRLALASPGTIMPSLRKALVQLLTEVQHGGDSLQREESAMLLGHLIHSASALMVPYVDTILQVLIPKLRSAMAQSATGSAQGQQLSAAGSSLHAADSDHMVSSCILEALGQLSAIGGHILTQQSSGDHIGTPAARSYLSELLPILLTILQDKSSRIRKEVALRTLNQLIAATGYAVDPYFRYPALLECLLGLLRSASQSPNAVSSASLPGSGGGLSSPSSKSVPVASITSSLFSARSSRRAYSPGYLVRREAIKLLGVLGALDPFVYRQLLADQAAAGVGADTQSATGGSGGTGVGAPEKTGGVAGGVILMPSLSESLSQLSDDYYPRMAIQALLRILRDDSLATHHNKVVQAVMFIVKSLGATPSKLARFLPLIVPAFLQEIKRPVFFTSGTQAAGAGVGAGGAVGGGAGAAGLASAGAGAQAGLGAAPGSGDSSVRDSLFIQLGQLISIVRLHIKPYLQAIFELISTGLGGGSSSAASNVAAANNGGSSAGNADSSMALLLAGSGGSAASSATSAASSGGSGGGAPAHQSQQAAELWTVHILILIEKIVLALRDDFAVYLPSLLPHMLALLHADHSFEKHITLKILHTFNVINQQYYSSQSSAAANKAGSGGGSQTQGSLSTDYLYLIIPSFLRLAEHPDSNMLVKQAAVGSLAAIARILNIHEYASRILLPLARMLDTPDIAPATKGSSQQPSAAAAAAAVGSPSAALIAASLASLTNSAPTKKPPELLALLHPPSLAPLREDILQLLCILAFQFQHNFLHYVPLFQRIFAQPGWVDKNLGLPQALKGETASSATRGPAHIEAFTACYTHPTSYTALPPVVNSYFERWELIVAKLTAFSKLLPSDLEGVRLGLRAHFGFGLTGLAGAVMHGALTFGIPVHAMGGPAVVAGLGMTGGWAGATGASGAGTPGTAGAAAGTTAGGTKTDAGGAGAAAAATGNNNTDGTPGGGASNALSSSDADFSGDGFDAESFGGSGSSMLKKLNVSQPNLKKVWEVSQRSTKDDWIEWMRSFSIELLKESPSPALRACSILAQKYPLLARELFHAAFVSCWSELSDQYQDDLIRCLESCFHAPNLPAELLQILLNLAEFMERDGKTLPIDTRILGSLAQSVHAYAKALHYAESEWIDNPAQTTESLILINNQLGNPEAAIGILTYTKKSERTGLNFGAEELSVSIYEKLNRWEDALEAYERKLLALPFEAGAMNAANGAGAAGAASNAAIDYTLGRMRCLKALGEWERLHTLSEQTWTKLHRNAALQAGISASSPASSIVLSAEDEQIRREVAPLGAAAAWNLGAWNAMAQYLPGLEEGRAETEILRAVIALQSGDVGASLRCIERTRELLDTELVALMGESYQRAYRVLVQVQQLSELEEIIQIRQAQGRALQLQGGGAAGSLSSHALTTTAGGPPALVRQMWSRRLLGGVARNVEVWQSLLLVRSIVLHPRDDMDTWLKFSSLCRKNGQLALSLKVLTTLLGFDPHNMEPMQESDLTAFATGSAGSTASASPSPSSSSRRTLPLEFPNVTYTYLKHLWSASGDGNLPLKADALLRMQLLIQQLNAYTERGIEAIPELQKQVADAKPALSRVACAASRSSAAPASDSSAAASSFDPLSSPFHLCNLSAAALARLRSRIYLKMGLWQLSLTSFNESSSEAKWSEKRQHRSAASFAPSASSFSSSSSASFASQSPHSSSSGRISSPGAGGGGGGGGGAVASSLNEENIPRILLNFQRATEEIALMDSLLHGTAAPQPQITSASAASADPSSSSSADPTATTRPPARPLVVAATASDAITPAVSNRRFYKVHHHWAVINYRLVQHYKHKKQEMMDAIKAGQAGTAGPALPQPGAPKVATLDASDPVVISELSRLDRQIASHVIPAVRGFFRSIALAGDSQSSLQDILRLLTLWFGHGMHPEVEAVLSDGFLSGSLSIDTWLSVIPQIIARIDSHHLPIRGLIFKLLCKIGLKHAQALVYPLAVVSKSTTRVRKQSALAVLNSIQLHSSLLVEQSLMVSRELIRVAILWHEMWHEALEEASRLWFGQRNFEGMRATLAPLRRMMDRGASTLREIAFTHAFGRDFQEAFEWEDKYIASGNDSDLNQAWDILVGCFRRINKQLTAITDLELQYVSPTLLHARNLALAMPGTFLADRDCPDHSSVLIAYFIPSLKVIESKQRPRRLSIMGSDGLEYAFLLKGHEDLRQDKRVMQLFGLVNTLLVHDSETGKKDLKIRGYSVIPLAPNSGLISWLHNCDTLHALIKEYRDARCLINGTRVRLASGGTKVCEEVTKEDILLGANGMPVRVASVQPNLARREIWEVNHVAQHAAYSVSANHRLTLVCTINPSICLNSKPDANGTYSMQAYCLTPDGKWTSAGYCWTCEVLDDRAAAAMEDDEEISSDVFDDADLARLALLTEDAALPDASPALTQLRSSYMALDDGCHSEYSEAVRAVEGHFRQRHRGTRKQLLQEMRSAFFARPRSEYLLAGDLLEMTPAELLKAAGNLQIGGMLPRLAGVRLPVFSDAAAGAAAAASSSSAAAAGSPSSLASPSLVCVTVPNHAQVAHDAVAAEARRLDADHTSMAWTSMSLGQGEYRPVQYGVDQACIVYMLHNPLTHSEPHEQDGFGNKCVTFRNMERWLRALGISPQGIIVTELNPIASLTDEMRSGLERYRVLCARSVHHALSYGTTRVLVFGGLARLRWLQEADARGKTGAWTSITDSWVDGIRRLSFLVDGRRVTVFFSVHPCVSSEKRAIMRAMAAAHGVPFKAAAYDDTDAALGVMKLAYPPVTRVDREVLVTNIEIRGDSDQDKRYLIEDGIITHNSVLLNIEHRLMLQMAPDHQLLTLMQKVEVFEYALARTTGEDLAKVLWLTAPTSETWLDRRTNYTRSLAVMCIVGYILGLGDRHPCNIMVERHSGKSFVHTWETILHIDFGDCFEVAMQREKFPEKIPFRLTRMLITAMEVSGIEGTFRCTADSVMRVLRENKESVMAVLEAFVYDPLINWRLLAVKKQTMHGDEATNATAAQAAAGVAAQAATGDGATGGAGVAATNAAAGGVAADGAPAAGPGANPLTTTTGGPGGIPLAEEPLLDSSSSEVLNAKAVSVIARVESKLQGRDFDRDVVLDTSEQVEKLIQQATSHTNLCLCYIGWCPFW